MIAVESAARSLTGQRRQTNEDRVLADAELALFAVADGMGGMHNGARAAEVAIRALHSAYACKPSPSGLLEAVMEAHEAVRMVSERDGRSMGTAICAATVQHQMLTVVSAGDARCYLLRGGGIEQLTHDHTMAAALTQAGSLDPASAAAHGLGSSLTMYLGADRAPDPDVVVIPLHPGDRVLLCSDGLYRELSSASIKGLAWDDMNQRCREVATHGRPRHIAGRLVDAADQAGGRDNISAIVLSIQDSPVRSDGAEGAEP